MKRNTVTLKKSIREINEFDISTKKIRRIKSESEFLTINEKEKIYKEKNKLVEIDDFKFVKELGKGAYGTVYLVKRNYSDQYYAMKIIQFPEQVDKKFVENLINEIKILNIIDGKFLVKAYFSFIQNNCLFIVMDYMLGGDMRNLLDI